MNIRTTDAPWTERKEHQTDTHTASLIHDSFMSVSVSVLLLSLCLPFSIRELHNKQLLFNIFWRFPTSQPASKHALQLSSVWHSFDLRCSRFVIHDLLIFSPFS